MNVSAVFLDRDGVLNEDKKYASDPKIAKLLPGVTSAIRRLNETGMAVIVVSNQSGIARGFHTENDTRAFNAELDAQLRATGARVDGWYYCPHLPEGKVPEYAKECECRKPKPGMLLKAADEHSIDLLRAWMVGDKESDVAAGRAVGARTVLVASAGTMPALVESPTHVVESLEEAVTYILSKVS